MAQLQRVKKLEEKAAHLMPIHEVDTRLSEDDQDCLYVVEVSMKTLAWSNPHWSDIEQCPAYKRGWELHRKRYPITPVHLDPLHGNRCWAFFDFCELHDREPAEGDVLRFSEMVGGFDSEVQSYLFNQLLAEAWQRKISHLPYPLKWANELLYLRKYDHRTGAVTWEEHHSQPSPAHRWRRIEVDLGLPQSVLAESQMPIIPAVVFWIDNDGAYKVRPQAELNGGFGA